MASGYIFKPPMTVYPLLWENSSPSSNFAGRTIQGDLSAYTAVMVEYAVSTGYTNQVESMIVLKDGNEWTLSCLVLGGTTVRTRKVSVTDSGITFADGNQGTSTNNGAIIPTAIHGIKCIPL